MRDCVYICVYGQSGHACGGLQYSDEFQRLLVSCMAYWQDAVGGGRSVTVVYGSVTEA